jgi:hypothetical protein
VVHSFNIPGIKSRHDGVDVVIVRENTEVRCALRFALFAVRCALCVARYAVQCARCVCVLFVGLPAPLQALPHMRAVRCTMPDSRCPTAPSSRVVAAQLFSVPLPLLLRCLQGEYSGMEHEVAPGVTESLKVRAVAWLPCTLSAGELSS